MIQITRQVAKSVRTVFRKALAISPRSPGPPVQVESTPLGVTLRATCKEGAVEYRADLRQSSSESLVIPFALLTDCEGGRKDPVEIHREGKQVVARWNDRHIPQVVQHPLPKQSASNEFPEFPSQNELNPASLIGALQDAIDNTDKESVRYALNTVRLSGKKNSLAATDGRHLLIHRGFSFPWQEDRFIARTTLFRGKELDCDEEVRVGGTRFGLALRTGPWTLHLPWIKGIRFPSVDDVAPAGEPTTTVTFSEADKQFLLSNLDRLPCQDELNGPITLAVDDGIFVRAKGSDSPQVTELELRSSSGSGDSTFININRRFFARALKLGLSQIRIFNPDRAILAADQQRSYIWMPLDKESAIRTCRDPIRIESAEGPRPVAVTPHQEPRNTIPMPSTKAHAQTSDNNSQTTPSAGVDQLIDQAEALKGSLRTTLNQTNDLISALKQQRKQAKVVQSTLASLRQLQDVA